VATKRSSRDALLHAPPHQAHDDETASSVEHVVALTVVYHPDLDRIGEESTLGDFDADEISLSRVEPDFSGPDADDSYPLADPFVSRKPVVLSSTPDGGMMFRRENGASTLTVDGRTVEDVYSVDRGALDRGVILELSQRVVLVAHRRLAGEARARRAHDMVGENPQIHRVRNQIDRVADLAVPILIRGESGTGKELVARALHSASNRGEAPCVCVNMGAIQATVAASELFGHAKGAFTGAMEAREGYFSRADSGTLFLDEIGETPGEVQVMLLRALETGAIQPVGATQERFVDVRLVTATDSPLEELVNDGRFRTALLHRLSGYEIDIPPLRERRDDFGRLLVHFLRAELETVGATHHLELREPSDKPWLPASLVAKLARYDWPGNVRQLRNLVRQLVITNLDAPRVRFDRTVERLFEELDEPVIEATPSQPAPPRTKSQRRKPANVTEEELVDAMRANGWRIEQSAEQLNISRASMYMLIEKSTRLRTAKDLSLDELAAAHKACEGDLQAMSDRLEVSKGGLRLRLKELDKK